MAMSAGSPGCGPVSVPSRRPKARGVAVMGSATSEAWSPRPRASLARAARFAAGSGRAGSPLETLALARESKNGLGPLRADPAFDATAPAVAGIAAAQAASARRAAARGGVVWGMTPSVCGPRPDAHEQPAEAGRAIAPDVLRESVHVHEGTAEFFAQWPAARAERVVRSARAATGRRCGGPPSRRGRMGGARPAPGTASAGGGGPPDPRGADRRGPLPPGPPSPGVRPRRPG